MMVSIGGEKGEKTTISKKAMLKIVASKDRQYLEVAAERDYHRNRAIKMAMGILTMAEEIKFWKYACCMCSIASGIVGYLLG